MLLGDKNEIYVFDDQRSTLQYSVSDTDAKLRRWFIDCLRASIAKVAEQNKFQPVK